MAKLRKQWRMTGLLGGLLLLLAVGWASANTFLIQQSAPEDLLAENSFLYCRFDGSKGHLEAYQQTAEYKALYESGLVGIFEGMIDAAVSQDQSGSAEKAREAFADLLANGFVFAAALPQVEGIPIPNATVVFPDSGKWMADIFDLTQVAGDKVEIKNIDGRKIATFLVPDSPGIEIGIWAEGKHLVITAGPNAVAGTIACATGKSPSISSNKRWSQVNSVKTDYEQTSLVWLDWKTLQQTYGEIPIPVPLPEPITVSTILEMIGIDKLDQVISRAGYKGEAIWSETEFVGLTRKNGTTMTLKDLPALPQKMNWMTAFQFDASVLYANLISIAEKAAQLNGPRMEDQLEMILKQLPDLLGFDPKADFLDHLGNTVCVYDDANGGFFGAGTTLCISLKNPKAVKEFFDTQIERLEEYEEDGGSIDLPVYPFRVEKNGGTLIVFDIYGDGGLAMQYGAIQVIDNWLVIGLMPQAVEAFYLRTQRKLASWTPDQEHQTALDALPKEFTSITMMSPRDSYQMILNLATPFLPAIQAAVLQSGLVGEDDDLPFYVEDFPPPELVTAPMFPNITIATQDEQGTTYTTRASTFGIPMFGGNGNVSAVAAVGVGVALLLPAVQQARSAARRSASKNNLKQIGLAMHNYHDTHNHFPRGTVDAEKLKPEQRLSWAYSILPFIDQAPLYDQLRNLEKEKWNSEKSKPLTSRPIATYLNPGLQGKENVPQIHYAGMAGVGKDAPLLKVDHERAGIFGYNRVTRMRDIKDGTSNTIMTTEVNKKIGPWAQGGVSTIRSLTKKPYIHGPDGIGGAKNIRGVQVGLADGAVRLISENVDPKVMENLSKMNDGNAIGAF